MLEEVLSEQKEMRSEIKQLTQRLENSEKHQKMQDSQIAQIAQSVSRAQGTFPGKPDLNPVEHCNRIELRSGRTVGNPQIITQMEVDSEKEPTLLMPNQTQNRDGEEGTKKIGEACQTTPQNQRISFPQKLIASQKDEEFHRFLKKVKEICIEGILSNRRRKGDFETIALTEGCSALFMANSPPKLQDPGSFSIPCKIISELIPRAFSDLGASVSLLPYSLCKKLRLQSIKLTTMTLQLTAHSCRFPMGIVEEVPLEVGGCVIPTDFIIMDMKEDPKIPIILGRPFLATAGALIDVKNHKLSLEIDKERIEFDLSNSSNCVSFSQGNPSRIDTRKIDECTFRENSPPADDKKYMSCARKAKGADGDTNPRRRATLPWV
ncbi:uncharacterized protein LOC121978194 [Zingiber officinale]|uniref:uncharacterized protein LOC121978194 n=1 Tax=Zingiber officinale TaxID=94328 RepID=UPI001C4BF3D5|nr:uncharacterized protein LOC121978194 [Zingiber officinale]